MATIHHNTLKKAEKAEIELRDLSGDMGRKFSAKWRDYVFIATDVQECLAAALLAKMLRLEYKISLNQRFDRKTKLPMGYEVDGLKRFDTLPELADIVDALEAREKKPKAEVVEVKETAAPVAAAKVAPKAVKAKEDAPDEQDEGDEDESEEKTPHTVVPATYRKAYAERGNPNNCGDWLAQMLDGKFSTNEGAFDRELFLRTMENNGVDITGKWTQSQSPGWQGRLRMTGRLKLEIALLKSGKLVMPTSSLVKVPEDYMEVLKSKHKSHIDG